MEQDKLAIYAGNKGIGTLSAPLGGISHCFTPLACLKVIAGGQKLQEDPSGHDCKIVDWDANDQNNK